MFKLNSKLTMACSAAVLALAMAACSSSDDNPPVAMGDPQPPAGDGGPGPVLTELEMAQVAAAAAATAAMTASGEAEAAAEAAKNAIANLATMQTGATSATLADEAAAAAYKAMAAYEVAKAASEAAAAAEDVTAAVEAKVAAENAQAAAETAATEASEKGTAAETAAMAELMIDGTVKTVGGTDLDAEAGSSVVVTGEGADAQTVRTGLIKSMNPMTTGPGVPADNDDSNPNGSRAFVEAMPDEDPAVVGVAHKQAVAPRTFAIGKVVDSADDMARLMLVTSYAGSNSVKVYADTTVDVPDDDLTGRLASDAVSKLKVNLRPSSPPTTNLSPSSPSARTTKPPKYQVWARTTN